MKGIQLAFICLIAVASTTWAGSITVIDNQTSGSSGDVVVKANAVQRVSLTVSDTGANDLVTPTGIDFGDVDADGTPGKIAGTSLGGKGRYVGDFTFSATRSGTGNVTLTAERSVAGNFHTTDGVLIEDDAGSLQNLPGSGASVTVIDGKTEGDFNKQLGITVYPADSGALTSTVRFTLSAL